MASARVRLECLFTALAVAAGAHAGDEDFSAGATLREETTGRGDRDLLVLGAIRRAGTTLSIGYGHGAGRGGPGRHALLPSLSQEVLGVREDLVEVELDRPLASRHRGAV